jgi:Mce-associated membrane protein
VLKSAVAVVVVAAGLAVWGLLTQVSASGDRAEAERTAARAREHLTEVRADDDLAFSRDRDAATEFARHSVAVLNTLDYRNLDEDLAEWAEVTTGDLHDEVAGLGEEDRQQLLDAKSVSEGKVVSVAVRELDVRAGTATALAAVRISRTVGGQADVRYQRIQAAISRTDDGWKLSAIGAVPYLEAGP